MGAEVITPTTERNVRQRQETIAIPNDDVAMPDSHAPFPAQPPPLLDLLGSVPQVNFGHTAKPSVEHLRLAAAGLGICISNNDISNSGTIALYAHTKRPI